jgi:hypothetical protein
MEPRHDPAITTRQPIYSLPHQASHTTPKMPPDIERRLPPEQVDCKWWMRGYCARGKTCYFKHDDAMFSAHNKKAQDRTATENSSNLPASPVGPPAGKCKSIYQLSICSDEINSPNVQHSLLPNLRNLLRDTRELRPPHELRPRILSWYVYTIH